MLKPDDHVLEWLDDYLHEVLDATDGAFIERHCEQCRICQVGLEEAQKRFQALQAVPACEASEQLIETTLTKIDAAVTRRRMVRRRFFYGFMPAAAAIVFLASGGSAGLTEGVGLSTVCEGGHRIQGVLARARHSDLRLVLVCFQVKLIIRNRN